MSKKHHRLMRLFKGIIPQTPDFLGLVAQQCSALEEAIRTLVSYLEISDDALVTRINEQERNGHDLRQRNLDLLHRSFITPIDREDIYTIIVRIDHIFDYVKTAARELDLLEVRPDESMQAMAKQLLDGVSALHRGFIVFKADPPKAELEAVTPRIVERHIEKLYRRALADIFQGEAYQALKNGVSEPSVMECLDFVVCQIKRREVYRHLSNTADRLAHAGEILHDISIKYG